MEQQKAPARLWTRVIAALLALAVIGGSLFFLAAPGRSAGLPGLAAAYAEEDAFTTLKKGDSGKDVRAVQEALKKLGYYKGTVDGNYSRAFEQAVFNFQTALNRKLTGQIDLDTFLLLTGGRDTTKPITPPQPQPTANGPPEEEAPFVEREGEYSDKDHVAAYLLLFGELPGNYITKKEAQALGWVNSQGNLWQVAPGKSIGGDRFGNYEGLLPTAKGRQYYECDIDYELDREYYRGGRNGKRIIFSSDGLVFYTGDHYASFEQITENDIEELHP